MHRFKHSMAKTYMDWPPCLPAAAMAPADGLRLRSCEAPNSDKLGTGAHGGVHGEQRDAVWADSSRESACSAPSSSPVQCSVVLLFSGENAL